MSTAPQVLWDDEQQQKAPQVSWDDEQSPDAVKQQSLDRNFAPTSFEKANGMSPENRQANSFLLGAASGASGLPETMHPLEDAGKQPPSLGSAIVGPAWDAASSIYHTGKEILGPAGPNEDPEDALERRTHGLGTAAGTVAPFVAGSAAEHAPGDIGNALREPGYTPGKPNPLRPAVKAIAGLGKMVGGPEIANALIPERSSGPPGMFAKLPNKLTPEQQEFLSGGAVKKTVIPAPGPEPSPGPALAAKALKKTVVAPQGPEAPPPSPIASPATPSNPRAVAASTPSEGRPATWDNPTVQKLARWGDPDAMAQMRARMLGGEGRAPLNFSTAETNPREVIRFDAEGNPIAGPGEPTKNPSIVASPEEKATIKKSRRLVRPQS